MSDHTVQPGDCFSSIAQENGYYNYLTLYGHPDNGTIKGRRKNPNMLVEGDVVKVPDKRQKKVALVLDKETRIVLDRRLTKLRVAVVDAEGRALKVSRCKLSVGQASIAKLGSNGLLELEIRADEKTGSLSLTLPALPALDMGQAAPGAVAKALSSVSGDTVPKHPPKVLTRDFTDEFDDEYDKPLEIELTLRLGSLEPHATVRGGLQRLNNLGCRVPTPTATSADDAETKAVVRSYQKFRGAATPSGALSDILDDLATAHDKV
jgi:hypothetical protein